MAIRFSCGACNQPIEIDDEWASKQAACPYCKKTVTVPPESTLTDLSSIPTAQPLSPGWPPPPPAGPRTESPNHLAVVAAILAGVAVILMILFASVLSAHREELAVVTRQAEELTEGGEPWLTAMQKSWSSLSEQEDGLPPDWIVALGILEMGLLLAGLAAFVCSIIACFRRRRRKLAILALIVTCLLPLVSCGLMGSIISPAVDETPASTVGMVTRLGR